MKSKRRKYLQYGGNLFFAWNETMAQGFTRQGKKRAGCGGVEEKWKGVERNEIKERYKMWKNKIENRQVYKMEKKLRKWRLKNGCHYIKSRRNKGKEIRDKKNK